MKTLEKQSRDTAQSVKNSDLTINNSNNTVSPTVPTIKNSAHGGKRDGSGRKVGSTHKITAAMLLAEAERQGGESFEMALIKDWLTSAPNSDLRFKYNNLILNKVVADQHHVEIDESTTVENRQHAFLRALETIGTVALQQTTIPYDDK